MDLLDAGTTVAPRSDSAMVDRQPQLAEEIAAEATQWVVLCAMRFCGEVSAAAGVANVPSHVTSLKREVDPSTCEGKCSTN